MNTDQVKGKWKQLKGAARDKWGKLTGDDWDRAAGNKDMIIGKIQEYYGKGREEARREYEEWEAKQHPADKAA